MGAGKTTLGNLVSDSLGIPYLDNDRKLSELNNMSIGELSELPIAQLHTLEIEYLREILKIEMPFIAGVAASVVDYPKGIELLKRAVTIYLRIPLEKILERAGSTGVGRQALTENATQVATSRFERRDPIYQQVADLTLNLSDSPSEDAQKIISFLRTRR